MEGRVGGKKTDKHRQKQTETDRHANIDRRKN